MVSKLEKILEELIKSNDPLTTNQIANRCDFKIRETRVFLNTLYNKGHVKRVNDKKPYEYRAITPKALLKKNLEYLKFLNDFFKNNIDYLMNNQKIDNFIEKNEEIFNKIEEMLCQV